MANIKISELNEITKKAYDDYLPIVDSSASETKKISVKDLTSSNVELLAVSDTAPSECSEGDKYYNTETGLIYTAVDTDTWGTVGEEPIEDILYVVFSEKNTYAWNGTDMLSVGGGSGSEIVIGDEEPTEDTKMIIDTDAFDPQYSDITNEYSEASNMAYSCDYINGTVLYENDNGTTGNVTLNESNTNYAYVDIIFRYQSTKSCLRCYGNGTYTLSQSQINQDGRVWEGFKRILINNDTITVIYASPSIVYNDANQIVYDITDQTYILKVIGYNKVGE